MSHFCHTNGSIRAGRETIGLMEWYSDLVTCLSRFGALKVRFLPACHETTARAVRLEQGCSVTLVRLASNVRVFRGYRRGTLEGSATPLQGKGRKGFVHGAARWNDRERSRSFTRSRRCCADLGGCREGFQGSRVCTKKLDLKSNCGPTTA